MDNIRTFTISAYEELFTIHYKALTLTWEDNITAGKGKSYGVEMLFEKKKGRLTGWAGYTLSWTTFQFKEINGDEPFRPRHDRRHNFNITGLYDISNRIKFSFNWSYLSGAPITIMSSNYIVSTSGPLAGYTTTSGFSPEIDMAEYSKKGAYLTDAITGWTSVYNSLNKRSMALEPGT